jgi:hypothetical protein
MVKAVIGPPDASSVYEVLLGRHSYAVKANRGELSCEEAGVMCSIADSQRQRIGDSAYVTLTTIHAKHVEAELTEEEVIELTMHDFAFAFEKRIRKTRSDSIAWWRNFVSQVDQLVHGPISRIKR